MAQVKRSDPALHGDPYAQSVDRGADVGGRVGGMQAQLAQRLIDSRAAPAVPDASSGDRALRILSAGGGYVGMVAGYAMLGWAIVFWL